MMLRRYFFFYFVPFFGVDEISAELIFAFYTRTSYRENVKT